MYNWIRRSSKKFAVCRVIERTQDSGADIPLEMTEEEKASIFAVPEFLDFVEHSTKIIQRALNDSYDYVRDYTIGAETGA